ncbi:hypothetical protein, conserved [Eimeria tenella]|uniref:Uncharacterized protein n=1 Tax=Eimeria tenella TaxID=5802 RepID=U6KJT9_EIMTE|nr:hypothetical protein, conserved [Eimeria tenella]CDJ37066.1 hypothetical protein, conserved [Eimeria tenella]|eukprot:XP_013227904.1 hypothetical protein, conserved [Eimeria tenella]
MHAAAAVAAAAAAAAGVPLKSSSSSSSRVCIGSLGPQQQGLSLLCIVAAAERDPSLRGVQQHKLLFRVADSSGSVTLALPLGLLRSAAAAAAALEGAELEFTGPGAAAAAAAPPASAARLQQQQQQQLSAAATGAATAAAADTAAAVASVAAAGVTAAEAEALKLLLPPSAVVLLEGAYTSCAKGKLELSVSEGEPRFGGSKGAVSVLGFFFFPFVLSPYISDTFGAAAAAATAAAADRPWQRPAAIAAAAAAGGGDEVRLADAASGRLPLPSEPLERQQQQQQLLLLQQQQQQQQEDVLSCLGVPDPIMSLAHY